MHQQELMKALTQLNGSLEELFAQIQPEHLEWRPRENMRTVMELANHLAQIPSIDLKIMQSGTEAEVRALEGELHRSSPGELVHVWRSGIGAVGEFFGALSQEQFETQVGTAFYGHAMPMSEWLLEIITHAYHHRAQLFTYLKMLGRPVDMFTLYL
ncbi:MAG TPA: DinB family protein [Symbiobacteriaceae bacterium]|nr:DinB family protein [Symbiobacteriaceae bacterium]